jgi:hypothetical protein
MRVPWVQQQHESVVDQDNEDSWDDQRTTDNDTDLEDTLGDCEEPRGLSTCGFVVADI